MKNTCVRQCVCHSDLDVPEFVPTAVFSVLDLNPAYASLQANVECYPRESSLFYDTNCCRVRVSTELWWTFIEWLRGDHSKRSQLWERTSLCARDDAFKMPCPRVRAFHPALMSAVLVSPVRASFCKREVSACLSACHSSSNSNDVMCIVIDVFLKDATWNLVDKKIKRLSKYFHNVFLP